MRPAALLLSLGLGLGLGLDPGPGLNRGHLPQPPAPRRAQAAGLVSGTPAASIPAAQRRETWRRCAPGGTPRASGSRPAALAASPAALQPWRRRGPRGWRTSPARAAAGAALRPAALLRAAWRAHARGPAFVCAPRPPGPLWGAPRRIKALGPPEWTFWLLPVGTADLRRPRRAASDLPAHDDPGPYAGFVAQTKCPTDGPTPVVLEAVNSDGPQAIDSSVSCQVSAQLPCEVTMVKINRNKDGVPLVVTRKLGDTLNATFRFNCEKASLIVPEWHAFSVPSVNDVPDWNAPLDTPHIQLGRTPAFLYIAPNSFSWGVYVFRFTVSLFSENPKTLLATGSDFIYVTILRSDLKAVVPGGPNITINFTDRLVLDGTNSSDPDSDNPSEGLLFSWYCTTDPKNYQGDKITVMSNSVCLPKQTDLNWKGASGPVLTLSPGTVKGGGVYFFRMVIQKGGRTAYIDKRVHVLKGPTPKANISCIENCDAVLVISDRFSLFLNCTNCSASQDVYKWSILSSSGDEITFDWVKHTTTGRNGAYLSIKAFAFKDFPEAKFWISAHLAAWSGENLDLRHPFIINYVPEIGECTINPAKGVAFFTRFVIRCNNFKDKNIPLTYKMIVSDLYGFGQISSVKENTLGAILYLGSESTSPPSFLPVGVLANRYAMKIYVQVYDSLGAFSQVTLYATVRAPTDEVSEKDVLDRLFNFTMGPNSSLSTMLANQEFLPAGYLMYIAASVLNNMKPELTLQADKARLREYLVNQTFILPNSTLVEISQVVMSVTKLTQTTSGFTRMAQKLATVRVWQANRALQQSRQKDSDFHSEQIEIVSTGILTSLSNIFKLTVSYEVVDEPFYVLELLADTILEGKVPGNETTAMTASSFNVYVRKAEKWDVTDVFSNEKRGRNYFRPTLNVRSIPSLPANAPISTMFCEFARDPFPWMNAQESCSADVVGFRMTGTTPNGDAIEIMPDVAEAFIARRNLSSATFNLTVGPENGPEGGDESLQRTTGQFRFEVDSSVVKELLVHIVTEVTVLFTVLVYAGSEITPSALVATFLVPHDIPPVATQSDLFDSACSVKEARVVCLPASLLQVIAQRCGSAECTLVVVLQAPRFVMKASEKLVRIALFSVRCLDMYGIQSDWREDTCVLGEKTTWRRVHCICQNTRRARRQLDLIKQASTHLKTHFLTAKVFVVPNAVDLQLEVIKNITHNPVTLFAVLFIMLTYIILAFWALLMDEMDQYLRLHVIILLDNDPYDKVCYLVTIFTGSRCGAGTKADVFIQLKGTEGESDVHCLSHPYFPTLYRGGINTFLLTTKRDLGDIRSIRVWHNNEGKAPSWYLSRIKVENLFSRHIWLFLCREWLSIDQYRTPRSRSLPRLAAPPASQTRSPAQEIWRRCAWEDAPASGAGPALKAALRPAQHAPWRAACPRGWRTSCLPPGSRVRRLLRPANGFAAQRARFWRRHLCARMTCGSSERHAPPGPAVGAPPPHQRGAPRVDFLVLAGSGRPTTCGARRAASTCPPTTLPLAPCRLLVGCPNQVSHEMAHCCFEAVNSDGPQAIDSGCPASLAYVVDEGYVIVQERASYVRSVYNLLNLALKCIFTALIVLFFRKHFLATGIIRFYLSNPADFIPFHAVSHVDHVMRIVLGFLLFLTILKTLRYSRFFYAVRLAQRAIQAALPGICHVALLVSVYFFVFMAFGYLVFGQHEWNYSNPIHATQTIFSYCVSAFQNTEFSHSRVLGVLFLSSFMLVMICILMHLFQAVILSAYEEMKQTVYEEPSDEAEAMTYLCRKLRAMFRFLTLQPREKEESELFVNMLYGQPESKSRRYLGLKTRNINGNKMVYIVV
ncbi:polycystic kidney disease and receptor for egg jelly-related protein-like [Ursus maritimus]|uniref:Polycystin family receptor for egg jelly n=1 Tax=Ursus maritimus TaxID=29073 RepID=A0A8M1GBJ9_URSMA|nr:polycystic kidney disease and receptor for egg jelly-related protein-like [Ursus maritimus]